MSIFVDNTPFPVELDFIIKKHPKTGQPVGVRVLKSTSKVEDKLTISCMATGRDFDRTADGLEQVTVINHRNDEPYIVTKAFCHYVMLTFFVSWNITDDKTGEPIPITREAIGRMHHSLVKALVRQWLDLTG